MNGWRLSLLLLGVAVFLTGCSKGGSSLNTVPVKGRVTLDGAPLPGATVTFSPKTPEGRTAAGMTNENGEFVLTTIRAGDGAVPGEYGVAITKPVATAGPVEDPRARGGALTPEQMAQIREQAKAKAGAEAGSAIPKKYTSPATSGFTVTVKPGEKNEFTFELKSQ